METMLRFSPDPGPRERHLQRRHANPLFGEAALTLDQADVDAAREADARDQERFLADFRTLVQEAVELPPHAESDQVLAIKARLDESYTRVCALPGDHAAVREAIRRLIEVIMAAIRKSAAGDPLALQKLDEEAQARALHMELVEHPLVADLLLPDTPIAESELLPTLLAEEADAVTAATTLFEPEQLAALHAEGERLLADLEAAGHDMRRARENLSRLAAANAG